MIASVLAGETQLYHELIRPYERSVYMMALSYMKNEADAEDVAQEAFLKAFHHLASFRAEAKFSTWLVGIALNEARSRLRHLGPCEWNRSTIRGRMALIFPPGFCETGGKFLPKLWSARKNQRCCRRRLQASPTSIVRCFYCAMWRS